MKGEDRYLSQLLEGSKTRFLIPVYQRNYDWKLENCKQLFDDLVQLVKSEGDSHFFGSIVSKAEGEVRIVIDGQQRITTSYLLLLALVRSLELEEVETTEDNTKERIDKEYLIDQWHKDDIKLKLKLIKDDQAAFEALYKGNQKQFIEDSNVTQNYRYFCDRIKESNLTAEEILNAIENLMIIDIQLERDDDPQRIFESLNSTGLDLSEGDKIRNYILMGLESQLQEEYYEKYWNEIEKNTNYHVSDFVRDYLSCVVRKTPNQKMVYSVFKDFKINSNIDTEDLLKDLLRHSEYYKEFTTASTSSTIINAVLMRFQSLGRLVTHPYLMSLFGYWHDGNISEEQVEQVLVIIETYIFRRWTCGVPTNALNKIFVSLHNEVLKGVNEGGEYVEVLKKVLLAKDASGRFPNNSEFVSHIKENDFYSIQNIKYYLYDRLENRDSKETKDVVTKLKNGDYTIEHVMPQTLNSDWIEELGENYKEIHEKWLNKIANLTLTGYNSKYSNRPFKEKKTIENGFEDSNLRINKFIRECENWNEESLQKREDLMVKRFLKLWPMISSEFEWTSETYDMFDLDDIDDFTGRTVAAFNFLGKRFEVASWAEAVCAILYMVHKLYPGSLKKYTDYKDKFPGAYFKNSNEEKWEKITDDVYYYPRTPTYVKIDTLRIVFNDLDIDQNELVFELVKE